MANHITCPGCRILLAIPDRLAGKVLRCPRCKTALPEAEAEEVVNTSEAITDRLNTPSGLGTPSRPSLSRESASSGTEARIQMKCERCGDSLMFASTEMGTVQECAASTSTCPISPVSDTSGSS
jgi:phage FluMu protein Com